MENENKTEKQASKTLSFLRAHRWLTFLIPFLIILLVGLAIFLLRDPEQGNYDFIDHKEHVQLSKDYYVTVTLVELSQYKNEEGAEWDTVGALPDIYFTVSWHDNVVFRSSVKKDTLIAKWSNVELDVRDLAIMGQKVSIDDAVKAARINITEDQNVIIDVYDKDLLGSDDLAGELTIKATDLWIGDTEYILDGQGLKRVVVRVAPIDNGLDMLK